MKRWVKWAVFAVGFVLFLALTVKGVDLGNRAVVVGLAVDKAGDEYTVTAQVIVPVSGGESASGASGGYVVTSVEAESLSVGFTKLAEAAGKAVALSHCNVFILGKSVMEEDAYRVLDYVVRNSYLSENAFILTAENGKDILSTNVAYGEMTSLYLREILNERGVYSDIARRTVKDYIRSYYSENKGNWLPLIEKTEAQTPQIEGKSSSQKAYVFSMNKTCVVCGNRLAGELGEASTEGLVYLTSKVERGAVTLPLAEGGKVSLYIIGSKVTKEYNPADTEVLVKLKLTCIIKEIEKSGEGTVSINTKSLGTAEEEALKSYFAEEIGGVFEACKRLSADILDCYDGFYRVGKGEWKRSLESKNSKFLETLRYSVDVKPEYE